MWKLVCISILFWTLFLGNPAKAWYQIKPPDQKEILTVSFCDLIDNPQKYQGQVIRTRATYRHGFEWSELYCLGCGNVASSVWLDYDDDICSKSKRIKGENGTENIQIVGKFYGPGHFGHMGTFTHKFLVTCVESTKKIWNDSSIPGALPPKIAKKACSGTSKPKQK